jgi:hypothetical protein
MFLDFIARVNWDFRVSNVYSVSGNGVTVGSKVSAVVVIIVSILNYLFAIYV